MWCLSLRLDPPRAGEKTRIMSARSKTEPVVAGTQEEGRLRTKLSRREAVRTGMLWKLAAELDMSKREIICLQGGHKRKELAAMFGLSEGRVSQIRAKAVRKMRHPFRVRLAIALGLAHKIGLSDDDIAHYRDDTPIDYAVERFRWRNGLVREELGDEN